MISCLSGRPRPYLGLPQLCCTSPLRVYSWQSMLVFSLGFNPRCLSHRTQPPLTTVGVQIISQLGSTGWNWFLWWILSILPYEYLLLCSPLRFQAPPPCSHLWGNFWVNRNVSSFTAPSQRCRSLSQILCFFFVFFFPFFLYFLLYFILWRLVYLLVSLEASASI